MKVQPECRVSNLGVGLEVLQLLVRLLVQLGAVLGERLNKTPGVNIENLRVKRYRDIAFSLLLIFDSEPLKRNQKIKIMARSWFLVENYSTMAVKM